MKLDIEVIKRKMLVKYPFFGSVVANIDYKETFEIATAGTDGKVIYYNPNFLEKLSVSEQIFIFTHEICHVAFNHILRSEGKDSILWNTATDAVINALLKKDGLSIVEGAIDIKDAINYDAEELYQKLLKEMEHLENNENLQSEQNRSDSNPSNNNETEKKEQDNSMIDTAPSDKKKQVGHDTHSMWNDAVKRNREEQNMSDQTKEKNEIEKKQEEIEQFGEKEAFKKNLKEKKKELEELKKELFREVIPSSTNKDNINITNIGRAKPLIDWRYVLREATKYDVDWSYRNATIEDGVISAKLEEESMPETEIVLDTSGSINETLLKNFLRECKNILQHSRLKVGCFDTAFYGFHEIRKEHDIDNMKFVGGGGTNFDAAIGAFSRRVENKIIFTDGRACMPNMPLDAIWIVFGETQIKPKGGKVIQIDNEQLDKLRSYKQDSSYKKVYKQ